MLRVCLAMMLLSLAILPARAAESPDKLTAASAFSVAPDCARDNLRLQRHPAAAFGKSVYLVAWCDGTRQADTATADIYCARVEAGSGKVLDPRGIPVCAAADLQEWPAVAFDGRNFLVVWQDLRSGRDYDVYAARVSEEGNVLDPGGFPVSRHAGNQARPAVGFASGNYLVAWMDARQYPVYGVYGARVTPEGKVPDPDGQALDAEEASKISKATPPDKSWLGDRHYWWNGLSSRFQPAVAGDGKHCLVTCLSDLHSNHTMSRALLVNPANLSILDKPATLPGHPKSGVAPCAIPDGWLVAFDHWMSGWSPTPRLAAIRLDRSLKQHDAWPYRADAPKVAEPAFFLDLQKAVAGGGENQDYQQGKGHFAFWQARAAWNGSHAVVVMDFGWRTKGKPAELNFAVTAARFDVKAGRFLDEPPLVVATGNPATGTSVTKPCLAAGPNGEVLVVYERDTDAERLLVEGCLLRAR
jgi:hypothetical protein